MSEPRTEAKMPRPWSAARRQAAQMRLCLLFYLGLGAPGVRRTYPECRLRAAAGRAPDLVRDLVALYRGEGDAGAGTVETINFRSAAVTPAGGREKFFVKEFPRGHAWHDVERALRCSRVDRAWRAAHLLPRLGILTPRAVGAAVTRAPDGAPLEFLVTEWLERGIPYHLRLRAVSDDTEARRGLLEAFGDELRRWHDRGIYLRDLVKNVLTRESDGGMEYWLTDLDQIHPGRRVTRSRVLHQMRQLARWSGPLAAEEARAIVGHYLGTTRGRTAEAIEEALLTAEPAEPA